MRNERVTKLLPSVEKEADRLNSKMKLVKMADVYKAFSLVEQEKCGPCGGLSCEHIEELTLQTENMQLGMTAAWVHLIVSLQLMKETQEIFRQMILPTISEMDGERLMQICDEGIKSLRIQQENLEELMFLHNIITKD